MHQVGTTAVEAPYPIAGGPELLELVYEMDISHGTMSVITPGRSSYGQLDLVEPCSPELEQARGAQLALEVCTCTWYLEARWPIDILKLRYFA